MFYEVKTINGVKTKVPLTNSSGVVAGGNPIGTIISTYKKIKPANYLYCDGSTFDPEIYPGLYLYLGTNVLPDYRECAMVGAEKNTTNVFDSSETDPSTGLPGTQSHDVYTEGEFKDDQFQGHAIQSTIATNSGPTELRRMTNTSGYTNNINLDKIVSDGTHGTPRIGSTTHGKQKAVFYYIKAVDGVDITDEDAFLGEVKDYVDTEVADSIAAVQSYSTTEQKTGGTWIDGKPIYRKVITGLTFGGTTNAWTNSGATLANCDTLTNGIAFRTSDNAVIKNIGFRVDSNNIQFYTNLSFAGCDVMTIEYTKTTD